MAVGSVLTAFWIDLGAGGSYEPGTVGTSFQFRPRSPIFRVSTRLQEAGPSSSREPAC